MKEAVLLHRLGSLNYCTKDGLFLCPSTPSFELMLIASCKIHYFSPAVNSHDAGRLPVYCASRMSHSLVLNI